MGLISAKQALMLKLLKTSVTEHQKTDIREEF